MQTCAPCPTDVHETCATSRIKCVMWSDECHHMRQMRYNNTYTHNSIYFHERTQRYHYYILPHFNEGSNNSRMLPAPDPTMFINIFIRLIERMISSMPTHRNAFARGNVSVMLAGHMGRMAPSIRVAMLYDAKFLVSMRKHGDISLAIVWRSQPNAQTISAEKFAHISLNINIVIVAVRCGHNLCCL